MDAESAFLRGESLAHDIFRDSVCFVGKARGESGDRDVEGSISWKTLAPGRMPGGNTEHGKRDVLMYFITRDENREINQRGVNVCISAILDFELIKRLVLQDTDAQTELLSLAKKNSDRLDHYEIQRA